jgi:signal transduction histidine kinase
MLPYLVVLVVGCALLWSWTDQRDRARGVPLARWRRAGWFSAVLISVACAWIMPLGNVAWPVVLEVPAVALVILWAPPSARRVAPVVLALLGLVGIVLVLSSDLPTSAAMQAIPGPHGGSVSGGYGVVAGRAYVWRIVLLLQSVALVAAGVWLLWGHDRRRVPVPPGYAAALARWARPQGAQGWALLFPVAGALLLLLVDHGGAHPAWIWAGVLVGLALLVASLFPTAGADLAAVAVIALALWGTGDAAAPPPMSWLRAAGGGPVSLTASGEWRLALVGAAEAGAILALGVWLVPRTIVPHARSLLRPEPDPELAGRVQQLTRTRADAVDTAAAELRRVERDLHDGAQARLVALGMSLRAAERLITTSPQAAIALIAEARESSSKALTELRDLVRGIYPPVLADRGLADAVQALALDTPLRIETDIDLPGRVDAPVESACYFAVAEALANAVKHSGARTVQIRIRFTAGPSRSRMRPDPKPGLLRIEVTDNGTGGADPARGTGLHGMERRLATFDGILAVSSPPGGPTMIIMEVPCALSSPKTSTC